MSPTTGTKISESKNAHEGEVQDSTIGNIAAPTTTTTRGATKPPVPAQQANAGSTNTLNPKNATKIINDTAYHHARVSGSETVLENFNEIDYSSTGVVHLTTSAFQGAIITGGKISTGTRAAPPTRHYSKSKAMA